MNRMTDAMTLPGLAFTGYIENAAVNNGKGVPLYEMAPPRDPTRPDINTREGWNALADSVNRRSFLHEFGREPADRAELYGWVYEIVVTCRLN